MRPIESLLANFRCPKCRNTSAVAKEVALGSVAERIPLVGSGKYVFVSCALCGYTEVYNQKILVNAKDREQEGVKAAARETA